MQAISEVFDLPACMKVIRVRMHRWWVRTGWLWLLIPLVAVVFSFVSEQMFHSGALNRQLGVFQGFKILVGIGQLLKSLTIFSMLALWLLAVRQAQVALDAVLSESSAPILTQANRITYLIGLYQGLVPIFVLTLSNFLMSMASKLAKICTVTQPLGGAGVHIKGQSLSFPAQLAQLTAADVTDSVIAGLDVGFHLISAAAWLIALSVVAGRSQWLVWVLGCLVFALPQLPRVIQNACSGGPVSVRLTTGQVGARLASWSPSPLMFVIGCLAVCLAVWAFANRLRIAAWVSSGLLLLAAGINVFQLSISYVMYALNPSSYSYKPVLQNADLLVRIIGFTPQAAFNTKASNTMFILQNFAWVLMVIILIGMLLIYPMLKRARAGAD